MQQQSKFLGRGKEDHFDGQNDKKGLNMVIILLDDVRNYFLFEIHITGGPRYIFTIDMTVKKHADHQVIMVMFHHCIITLINTRHLESYPLASCTANVSRSCMKNKRQKFFELCTGDNGGTWESEAPLEGTNSELPPLN